MQPPKAHPDAHGRYLAFFYDPLQLDLAGCGNPGGLFDWPFAAAFIATTAAINPKQPRGRSAKTLAKSMARGCAGLGTCLNPSLIAAQNV
jgi:hypothetical protein